MGMRVVVDPLRITAAVILFAGQILCYNLNRSFLVPNLDAVKRLPGLTWLLDAFPVNHAETIAFVLYFLLHSLVTVAIIKCVYQDSSRVRIGALLTAAALVAYPGTYLIGKLGNLARMQAISLEIATFASSPLLTILLISALTLAKPSVEKPHSFVAK